jgi:hypothetical protein
MAELTDEQYALMGKTWKAAIDARRDADDTRDLLIGIGRVFDELRDDLMWKNLSLAEFDDKYGARAQYFNCEYLRELIRKREWAKELATDLNRIMDGWNNPNRSEEIPEKTAAAA